MTVHQIAELKQDREKLIRDSRAVLDKAETEKRGLTADEEAKYQEIDADIEKMGTKIQREERQLEHERSLAAAGPGKPAAFPETPGDHGDAKEKEKRAAAEMRSFSKFLRRGQAALTDEDRAFIGPAEQRALQADQDDIGGFLTTPEEFVNGLIKFVDDAVFIQQLATVHRITTSASLGVPSLDADPADSDWTTELGTGSEDSSMNTGKRALTPHPAAKRIKISNTLVRLVPSIVGLVTDRMGYKQAVTKEKAFLTGTGSQQPLGLMTASSNGISTARDISTDNTTTEITADGLIEAKYALKSQYHAKARWIFHRDAMKMIRKLKDGQGQYLFQQNLQVGGVDTILTHSVMLSEFMPNTFTTGLYVGILGDYSFYWIVESLQFILKRLDELYQETNQIGFIGRWEGDGMPVLEEAFARVTLA